MIHYEQAGTPTGPAIVFLHGGGLSARQWQPQVERLHGYHLLLPDLPSQGQSSDLRPFTLKGSADQLALMLDQAAPNRPAHLVGLSLGGAVALEFMRLYPDRVDHAIVTGTAAGLGRILGGLSMAIAGIYSFLPTETLVQASLDQFGIPAEYRPLVHDDLLATTNAEFTREYTRALMKMELPLHNTRPLLVAVGEKETIPARQAAVKLAREIPCATGVLVPGRGHVWNLQDPELFTRMVEDWFEGQRIVPGLVPLK